MSGVRYLPRPLSPPPPAVPPRPKSLWTAAPHVDPWHDQYAPEYPKPATVPAASDNAAESKVLLYGPKGEALIRQEPRPVGFRPRESR